jgi:hypothetical protein
VRVAYKGDYGKTDASPAWRVLRDEAVRACGWRHLVIPFATSRHSLL